MGRDILLVEDEPWLSDIYRHSLTRHGWQVHCSPNAQAALDILDGQPQIKLILLDLLLPGSNGLALLFEALSHVDWQDKQFVIMSSLPAEDVIDDIQLMSHLNVIGFLYKPKLNPMSLSRQLELSLL